jgi:hypothetical protein
MSQDPNLDESATNIVPPPSVDDPAVDTEGHRFHRFGETGGADETGDTEGHHLRPPRTVPRSAPHGDDDAEGHIWL